MGNVPRRNHFVAEMLQKRFADDFGRLHFFHKRRPENGVRTSSFNNLFLERDLYNFIANDGSLDPALEKAFADLEGRLDHVIEKAVAAARQNKVPGFTTLERRLWDRFFILQYKRVPDVHNFAAPLHEGEARLDELFAQLLERWPDKRDEVDALNTPEERKRLLHNAKVDALMEPSIALEQVLAQRGIAAIRITRPNKSFIIGSNPVVRFTLPGHTNILDPRVEVWLPVSWDIAIGVGLQAGTESFVPITEPSWVRHINEGIAGQSTVYAGRSKDLLCSLSGQPYRGRDRC
jgi:hypothetical protein